MPVERGWQGPVGANTQGDLHMSEEYQEELARRREEAEQYVGENYTDQEIAQKASEIGWKPEDYREWLIKIHGKLLIPCDARGYMK